MTNVFVTDLKAMCGALLHALWKIERSENPDVIPIDLAQDILGYLGSFREHEAMLNELVHVSVEESNKPNGNSEDHSSNISPEPTKGGEGVEDKKVVSNDAAEQNNVVDVGMNEEEKVDDHPTLNAVDETAQNEHIAIEEHPSNPQTIGEEIDATTVNDTSHAVALLTHAIDQLEDMNKKNCAVHETDIQNEPDEITIQAEVVVTTTQDEAQLGVPKRSKRKAQFKEEVEKFLQRRRSLDYGMLKNGATSHSDISSSNDGITKDLKMSVTSSHEAVIESKNVVKSMKNRHSLSRKTICVQRPRMRLAELNDDKLVNIVHRRNTDQRMYVKNEDFHKKWCGLCKKPQKHFVPHFVREHPESEIPISRPSPTMANLLRQQAQKFTQHKGSLTGICLFCEESKSLPKYRWVVHFLVHTGEKMFRCETCDATYKHKTEHTTCRQEPVNIHSGRDSVMGFICKDCNYTQLYRGNIIKHLENEHGYVGPEEKCHYEKVQLVPDLERIKPK
ncbi:RE1-silencing transcription factor-like [Sitodiplosis mosellana]|uniref:RE1-silencing transcription factor-like n=1 Tax=Sitodiplosis mosellana TaxID=263140 RepID=UPI00244509E6|nr:RE1-silencing transcription factor-like [Sitodiplosis mosellana]XP_055326721.1 RE1-silencing transcription factor-like [Sitodiplosis mosellana]